ncbi:unnamed protein product [Amoebophrya sp. A25]|nr:unnamed protein product [Amoebophrya sp. A25]|eukprot:GSA25T00022346001.1
MQRGIVIDEVALDEAGNAGAVVRTAGMVMPFEDPKPLKFVEGKSLMKEQGLEGVFADQQGPTAGIERLQQSLIRNTRTTWVPKSPNKRFLYCANRDVVLVSPGIIGGFAGVFPLQGPQKIAVTPPITGYNGGNLIAWRQRSKASAGREPSLTRNTTRTSSSTRVTGSGSQSSTLSGGARRSSSVTKGTSVSTSPLGRSSTPFIKPAGGQPQVHTISLYEEDEEMEGEATRTGIGSTAGAPERYNIMPTTGIGSTAGAPERYNIMSTSPSSGSPADGDYDEAHQPTTPSGGAFTDDLIPDSTASGRLRARMYQGRGRARSVPSKRLNNPAMASSDKFRAQMKIKQEAPMLQCRRQVERNYCAGRFRCGLERVDPVLATDADNAFLGGSGANEDDPSNQLGWDSKERSYVRVPRAHDGSFQATFDIVIPEYKKIPSSGGSEHGTAEDDGSNVLQQVEFASSARLQVGKFLALEIQPQPENSWTPQAPDAKTKAALAASKEQGAIHARNPVGMLLERRKKRLQRVRTSKMHARLDDIRIAVIASTTPQRISSQLLTTSQDLREVLPDGALQEMYQHSEQVLSAPRARNSLRPEIQTLMDSDSSFRSAKPRSWLKCESPVEAEIGGKILTTMMFRKEFKARLKADTELSCYKIIDRRVFPTWESYSDVAPIATGKGIPKRNNVGGGKDQLSGDGQDGLGRTSSERRGSGRGSKESSASTSAGESSGKTSSRGLSKASSTASSSTSSVGAELPGVASSMATAMSEDAPSTEAASGPSLFSAFSRSITKRDRTGSKSTSSLPTITVEQLNDVDSAGGGKKSSRIEPGVPSTGSTQQQELRSLSKSASTPAIKDGPAAAAKAPSVSFGVAETYWWRQHSGSDSSCAMTPKSSGRLDVEQVEHKNTLEEKDEMLEQRESGHARQAQEDGDNSSGRGGDTTGPTGPSGFSALRNKWRALSSDRSSTCSTDCSSENLGAALDHEQTRRPSGLGRSWSGGLGSGVATKIKEDTSWLDPEATSSSQSSPSADDDTGVAVPTSTGTQQQRVMRDFLQIAADLDGDGDGCKPTSGQQGSSGKGCFLGPHKIWRQNLRKTFPRGATSSSEDSFTEDDPPLFGQEEWRRKKRLKELRKNAGLEGSQVVVGGEGF